MKNTHERREIKYRGGRINALEKIHKSRLYVITDSSRKNSFSLFLFSGSFYQNSGVAIYLFKQVNKEHVTFSDIIISENQIICEPNQW